jgi:hypothetical protein
MFENKELRKISLLFINSIRGWYFTVSSEAQGSIPNF